VKWLTNWWRKSQDEEQKRMAFWDGLSCSPNGTLTRDLGKFLMSEKGTKLLADIAAIRTARKPGEKP
jgi:hypothetical protein